MRVCVTNPKQGKARKGKEAEGGPIPRPVLTFGPFPFRSLFRFGQVWFLSRFGPVCSWSCSGSGSFPCPGPCLVLILSWFRSGLVLVPFLIYIQASGSVLYIPYNGFGLVPFLYGSCFGLAGFPFPVSVWSGSGSRRAHQSAPGQGDGVKGDWFRAGTEGGGTGGGPVRFVKWWTLSVRFVNSSDMLTHSESSFSFLPSDMLSAETFQFLSVLSSFLVGPVFVSFFLGGTGRKGEGRGREREGGGMGNGKGTGGERSRQDV